MANWFYYDNNGQKQGPYTAKQLKQIAQSGVLLPETIIETESGEQRKARKVIGLLPENTDDSAVAGTSGIIPLADSVIVNPPAAAPNVSAEVAAKNGTNWFYYDDNGQKLGPINSALLKALVAQGVILPETIIETETGQQGRAGKIKGLTFPEMISILCDRPPIPPAENPFSQPPNPFNPSTSFPVASRLQADQPVAVPMAAKSRQSKERLIVLLGILIGIIGLGVLGVLVNFATNSSTTYVPANSHAPAVVNTPTVVNTPVATPSPQLKTCDKCSGRGTMFLYECWHCRGTGIDRIVGAIQAGARCTHCNGLKACGCISCENIKSTLIQSNIQGKCSKCGGTGNLGYQ